MHCRVALSIALPFRTVALCLVFSLAPLANAANSAFQDFGTVAVGSSSSVTLTYQLSGISGNPVFSLQYTGEYVLGQNSCSGSAPMNCSAAITFQPRWPGSRRSALRIVSAGGSVLATTLLNGTGSAAEVNVNPGQISTFAGTLAFGSSGDGGLATAATFEDPEHFAFDPAGNLFIADELACKIREVNATTLKITTVAGNGVSGFSGDGGPATAAELSSPAGVAIDGAGNLYIADAGNNRIRRVDGHSGVISTIAGTAATTGSLGDGGPATSARLSNPLDIVVAPDGTLYIADTGDNRIRKIDTFGNITTAAGGGNPAPGIDALGDGAPAVNAILNAPSGLALDGAGNLFIADRVDNLIRVVAAGIISVVAGNGTPAYAGDGRAAVDASISAPTGIAVDAGGWLYIADTGNSVIRAVTATGTIMTIAGRGGVSGYGGDNGVATQALMNAPSDVAIAASGDAYIVDRGNLVIRAVARASTSQAFPSTTAGSVSLSQTVMVANSGNSALQISSISIPAGFVQQSSGIADCLNATEVNAGSDCGLAIAFGPQQSGTTQGTVAIASNSVAAGVATGTVAVSGAATAASMVFPVVNVTSLSFGAQPLASTVSIQTFLVTNNSSVPLAVRMWLSGSDPNDFALTSATTCGATLAASTTCVVAVAFSPGAVGPRSATFSVTESTSSCEFTQSVMLVGSGTEAAPRFTQTTLSFGSQQIGTSTTLTATLVNPNADAVNLNGLVFSATTSDITLQSTTCTSTIAANGNCTVTIAFTPAAAASTTATVSVSDSAGDSIQPLTISGTGNNQTAPPTAGLLFVPLTPCRVVDTRNPAGAFGGPFIAAAGTRSFPLPAGNCGVPANAAAYALNLTVVPHGTLGYITVWPTGIARPFVSNLNSWDGRVKANATIVPAGTDGAVSVFATNDTDIILDVSGYFVPASSNSAGLEFYPITPCRVADTRGSAGSFGGPGISSQGTRSFPITSSGCGVPGNAQAYSLNFTAVPNKALGYVSVWPAGHQQPVVSTLNSYNGTVVANAAIVPAGSNGDISVYSSDQTDIILDINGYFAPPGGAGGLSLYNLAPCRVSDSRMVSTGAPYAGERTISIAGGACGVPATAKAYVLNATAIPSQVLGYLGLWPDGESQPVVSTLNSWDGSVVSNLAIVPTANGSVDTYLSNSSQLVLDIFGYFAP